MIAIFILLTLVNCFLTYVCYSLYSLSVKTYDLIIEKANEKLQSLTELYQNFITNEETQRNHQD